MEKKGLGRGLEALIPMNVTSNNSRQDKQAQETSEINIAKISLNPYQPRKKIDDEKFNELLETVRIHGIIQPILVRIKDDGTYELVSGERRLKAAKAAGLKTIPATVRELSDSQALEMAIIENAQREDINAIDSAHAYKQLADEFGFSQEMIALRIGKNRATIANTMRLLNLPKEVIALISNSELSEGQARPLLRIENIRKQIELANKIVREKLNARQCEELVANFLSGKTQKNQTTTYTDSNIMALSNELSLFYGTKVKITAKESRGKTKGKIEISFSDLDIFENILQKMRGNM